MTHLLCRLIRLWQIQAPVWGPRCRFYPSCSEYMIQSLYADGVLKGLSHGLSRLAKCHPWHPGGVDFVKGHYAE
jgi:putative membrane protein insertion efficiency factor